MWLQLCFFQNVFAFKFNSFVGMGTSPQLWSNALKMSFIKYTFFFFSLSYDKNIFSISHLICWLLAVLGHLIWQSQFGPDVVHKKRKKKKKLEVGIGVHSEQQKDAQWNADWKEEQINQANFCDWQLAKVFSVEVSRTAQLLSHPPSSLCHPLPSLPVLSITFPYTHHHTVVSSLNVSPRSPSISLTFHFIVPLSPTVSHTQHPIFSPGLSLIFLAGIHRQAFKAADWHSFNLVL